MAKSIKVWDGSIWQDVAISMPDVSGFATESYVTSAISSIDLSGKQNVVSGVSSTEIGYLDGVTSSIQTQIDSKASLASPTFTGTTSINQILEKATISATAATGTINYDLLTNGSVTYYTSDASGNWTLNVRGNGSTSLNSLMSSGQSLTIAFLVTNGSTAYYQSAFQIDGTSVTPKWQNGTAVSSGNASAIDIYSVTIIKTASNTFTVLASQSKFA